GYALWVGERAEHVEIAAHDGREIDPGELRTGARRATEHDPTAAPRRRDRLSGRVGRAGELDHQVGAALEGVDIFHVDDAVGEIAHPRQTLTAADQGHLTCAKRARELGGAEPDRSGAEHDDTLAPPQAAALEARHFDTEVVRHATLLHSYARRQ